VDLPPRPDPAIPPWEEPIARTAAPRVLAAVVALAVVLGAVTGGTLVVGDLLRREGTPQEHAFLFGGADGPLVRWNPCAPIHYVVNPDMAPTGSVEDVHEAVRRVSAATGIPFVYDGLTDEQPRRARDASIPGRYGEGWAPVLVAWVDPTTSDIPFDRRGKPAAAVARPFVAPRGERQFVSGWIAMNLRDTNPPGFGRPGDQGPTLLHEWGHILGLDHVEELGQLMERAGGRMTDLGPGDREGLRRLGREAGCLARIEP
jgi:hypothetical protein